MTAINHNGDGTVIWQPREGRVVFLDTETTGLDPATEQVFEIATICGVTGRERVYHLEPDAEVVERMHPKAAEVNRYHERTADPAWVWSSPHHTADDLRKTLTGAHIVGAVPDFDTRFLTAWYKHMGQDVPRWHYHLMDIENLAYGWMLREPLTAQERGVLASLPLDSDRLSQMCGVDPVPEDERHTALGDARWVMRWWNRLHGVDNGHAIAPPETDQNGSSGDDR